MEIVQSIINTINLDVQMYVKLFLSLLFGFLIGLERTRKQKPAGIRTHILVCLGSCLLMILSLESPGDPFRLAAQVVSGIGFIGAGVIWKDKEGTKHGLTTAANLWVTSAIGMVIGYGFFDLAIVAGIIALIGMNAHGFAKKIGIVPEHSEDDGDVE